MVVVGVDVLCVDMVHIDDDVDGGGGMVMVEIDSCYDDAHGSHHAGDDDDGDEVGEGGVGDVYRG